MLAGGGPGAATAAARQSVTAINGSSRKDVKHTHTHTHVMAAGSDLEDDEPPRRCVTAGAVAPLLWDQLPVLPAATSSGRDRFGSDAAAAGQVATR
jgi:hypothetical protein